MSSHGYERRFSLGWMGVAGVGIWIWWALGEIKIKLRNNNLIINVVAKITKIAIEVKTNPVPQTEPVERQHHHHV